MDVQKKKFGRPKKNLDVQKKFGRPKNIWTSKNNLFKKISQQTDRSTYQLSSHLIMCVSIRNWQIMDCAHPTKVLKTKDIVGNKYDRLQ